MTPPKQQTAEEIIRRILQEPVPNEGQLSHPLKSSAIKKQAEKLAVSNLEEAKNFNFPVSVRNWTPKNFVDYFAQKYKEESMGTYRRIYRSDIMIVQQMGDFLVSNGIERNYWTKRLIDWGFKHKEEILKRERHFTLQEILRQVNYFYQQEILPKVEENEIERDTQDTILLEEIQKADEAGKITEVFVRFGIPVGITYLVNFRNVNLENIIKATGDRIKTLYDGSVVEKAQLEKMLQASIISSPYPEEFLCLDWREKFSHFLVKYNNERWWRSEDYKGKPLAKYYALL